MRRGWLAIGAVSSSARSHALAAEALGGIAGIHREDGSGDALRTVAEKKFDGAGHVVDAGKALQRAAPLDLLPLLGLEPPGHVGVHEAGGDRIHVHAHAPDLPRKRAREADDGRARLPAAPISAGRSLSAQRRWRGTQLPLACARCPGRAPGFRPSRGHYAFLRTILPVGATAREETKLIAAGTLCRGSAARQCSRIACSSPLPRPLAAPVSPFSTTSATTSAPMMAFFLARTCEMRTCG